LKKDTFIKHLEAVPARVVPFTRKYVVNPLPDKVQYLLYPNRSGGRAVLHQDEAIFPEESLAKGKATKPDPITASQVIEKLWRNGKVPEWINVTVESYDDEYTYLRLDCCGRFTANESLIYHVEEGIPPFHCLGPALPPLPGGEKYSIDKFGKFDLYWRRDESEK